MCLSGRVRSAKRNTSARAGGVQAAAGTGAAGGAPQARTAWTPPSTLARSNSRTNARAVKRVRRHRRAAVGPLSDGRRGNARSAAPISSSEATRAARPIPRRRRHRRWRWPRHCLPAAACRHRHGHCHFWGRDQRRVARQAVGTRCSQQPAPTGASARAASRTSRSRARCPASEAPRRRGARRRSARTSLRWIRRRRCDR